MTDNEALEILRGRGHAAGAPNAASGLVRIWLHGGEEAVDVRLGKELHDLATGKLGFDDIRKRREYEVPVESS